MAARRTYEIGVGDTPLKWIGSQYVPVHLGEPSLIGMGWRYLLPNEVPEYHAANAEGPVMVERAIASPRSGFVVLTLVGVVMRHAIVGDNSSKIMTVRRIVVVDSTLNVHHIRHLTPSEHRERAVAVLSDCGNTVLVTNQWAKGATPAGLTARPYIEIYKRSALNTTDGCGYGLAVRFEIDHARLKARNFGVAKLCTFSPCSRFVMLLFENGTCSMLDIEECSSGNQPLRFRVLCNPAPRPVDAVRRFVDLRWNQSGIWICTTHNVQNTASLNEITASHLSSTVQNLALF